ncbi:hypothetical protein [Marisediminicola sp. UYEF4]|uniref:hypothetical protein n=1 Tax=Marisediminicola sp. UYEF4 TaxID=1756384 RepID=UPI003397900D
MDRALPLSRQWSFWLVRHAGFAKRTIPLFRLHSLPAGSFQARWERRAAPPAQLLSQFSGAAAARRRGWGEFVVGLRFRVWRGGVGGRMMVLLAVVMPGFP